MSAKYQSYSPGQQVIVRTHDGRLITARWVGRNDHSITVTKPDGVAEELHNSTVASISPMRVFTKSPAVEQPAKEQHAETYPAKRRHVGRGGLPLDMVRLMAVAFNERRLSDKQIAMELGLGGTTVARYHRLYRGTIKIPPLSQHHTRDWPDDLRAAYRLDSGVGKSAQQYAPPPPQAAQAASDVVYLMVPIGTVLHKSANAALAAEDAGDVQRMVLLRATRVPFKTKMTFEVQS